MLFHMYKPRTNSEYTSHRTLYNGRNTSSWQSSGMLFHVYKPQSKVGGETYQHVRNQARSCVPQDEGLSGTSPNNEAGKYCVDGQDPWTLQGGAGQSKHCLVRDLLRTDFFGRASPSFLRLKMTSAGLDRVKRHLFSRSSERCRRRRGKPRLDQHMRSNQEAHRTNRTV